MTKEDIAKVFRDGITVAHLRSGRLVDLNFDISAAKIAAIHDARVSELLAANNEMEDRARKAERKASSMSRRFIELSNFTFDFMSKRNARPLQALRWCIETFGPSTIERRERAARFLEEAIELVHADGIPAEFVARVTNRVYSQPKGDTAREIGQVGFTLEALAQNAGVSLEEETQREFDRVMSLPKAHWQSRHAVKVKGGIANLSTTLCPCGTHKSCPCLRCCTAPEASEWRQNNEAVCQMVGSAVCL